MRNIIKKFTCFVFLFFLFVPLAVAESEYLEDWVDTWTVRMQDDSIVTWEITETWASDTGKSHIAYGIKIPDDIEFQIYFGEMWMKHYYIEIGHEVTIYDLPMDFNQYTELLPSEDFSLFLARPGKYPIKFGWKGETEPELPPEPEPEPEPCVASYLLGIDDPRLDGLRVFRDETLSKSNIGLKMIGLYYEKSCSMIDICENSPHVRWVLKTMLEALIPIIQL